jgi:hypothetical protein
MYRMFCHYGVYLRSTPTAPTRKKDNVFCPAWSAVIGPKYESATGNRTGRDLGLMRTTKLTRKTMVGATTKIIFPPVSMTWPRISFIWCCQAAGGRTGSKAVARLLFQILVNEDEETAICLEHQNKMHHGNATCVMN